MKKEQWNEGLNYLDPELVKNYIKQKDKLSKNKKPKNIGLRAGIIAACIACILTASLVAVSVYHANNGGPAVDTDDINETEESGGSNASDTGVLPNASNTETESSNSETDETETPASEFRYLVLEDGTISVSYNGRRENVVVPEQIDGKTVTVISSFGYAKDCLKTVTLPDTIKKIKNECFMDCTLLESINFPTSLTHIGTSAFMNCASLKKVEIYSDCLKAPYSFSASGIETLVLGEGVSQIPDGCFAATKISKLELPSTVKNIEWQAFAACESLETVALNEGLVSIGRKAFVNNFRLKEITIPRSVTEITEMEFSGCSSLKKVIFWGNAPSTYECEDKVLYPELFEPINVNYTIYYYEGATGFTTPEWYGYPTVMLQDKPFSLDDAKKIASEYWNIKSGDVDETTGFRYAIFDKPSNNGNYRIALTWLVEGDHYSVVEIIEIDPFTGEVIIPTNEPESVIEDYIGMWNDIFTPPNDLFITVREDGRIEADLGVYRLTTFHLIITENDGKFSFVDKYDRISGKIDFIDGTVLVQVEGSNIDSIGEGAAFIFTEKQELAEAHNYASTIDMYREIVNSHKNQTDVSEATRSHEWYVNMAGAILTGNVKENVYGYALSDLNGDEKSELILMLDDYTVLMIFTQLNNGEILMVGDFNSRYTCWIDTDKIMHTSASNGADVWSYYESKLAPHSQGFVLLFEYGCEGYDSANNKNIYYSYSSTDGERMYITDEEFEELRAKKPYLSMEEAAKKTKDSGALEFLPLPLN